MIDSYHQLQALRDHLESLKKLTPEEVRYIMDRVDDIRLTAKDEEEAFRWRKQWDW